MNNEERDKALYKYPDSNILRNKLGITEPVLLERRERQFVTARIEAGVPNGHFDLSHLQKIHRHLFQDIYTWAGEIRKVDFHKGGSQFHPHERIEMGMADVHKRLSQQKYLRDLNQSNFARESAEYIGDVNRLHPFREGNGRAQLQYLKQLGEQAGHKIDLSRFESKSWIQASKEANQFKTDRMADCIQRSIADPARERSSKQNAYIEERRERARAAQAQRKDQNKTEDRNPKR